MKPKPKARLVPTLKRSLRPLLKWVPKTQSEKSRESRELDDMGDQMKLTVSHLSPEMQAEINDLTASSTPRDAEQRLLTYLVADDPFTELRKETRKGTGADERRMDERIWWLSVIPVLVALYFIFSVLWHGFGRSH